MKTVTFLTTGCIIIVLTIACNLEIYSIASKKNEMKNCVAHILMQDIKQYFGGEYENEQVRELVRKDVEMQLYADSEKKIEIYACDMQNGILSVMVKEQFVLPSGIQKTIQCEKTIIVEDYEQEKVSKTIKKIRCRFINSRYFEDENRKLIPQEAGGLAPDSRWAVNPILRQKLRKIFTHQSELCLSSSFSGRRM